MKITLRPVLWVKDKNKDGACPIAISITGGGKRTYYKTEIKVAEKHWSGDKILKGAENHDILNNKLSNIIKDADREILNRELQGERITIQLAKKIIDPNCGFASSRDFYSFAQSHIKDSNYSKESVRTYVSEISKMQQHSPALAFADINYKWLQSYEKWMRSGTKDREPNHPNTIWKSFKFINTIINTAIKQDLIKDNPFKNFNRGKYKQGIPVYLEWSEAQSFHNAIIAKTLTEYQRLQGYYALLSYYSGLRFGDAVNFDYNTKVIEDTTGKRLVLYAAKNGEIVSISFTKYIDEVVNYIKDRPIKITNQEFNETIKIIAGVAEIKKTDLSSHSFRHGFAMRCAELGMSIDEVQRLLGHNKRTTTEIYFRIKDKRLDSAMSKW